MVMSGINTDFADRLRVLRNLLAIDILPAAIYAANNIPKKELETYLLSINEPTRSQLRDHVGFLLSGRENRGSWNIVKL